MGTSSPRNHVTVPKSNHAGLTFTQMKSLRNNNTAAWLNNVEDDPANARMHISPIDIASTQSRAPKIAAPTQEYAGISRYTKDIGAWAEKVDRDYPAKHKHLDIDLESVRTPRKEIENLLRDVNDTFHNAERPRRT